MFLNIRHLAILTGTVSLLAAVNAGNARAGDLGRVTPAPEDWEAVDHCAAYGPDFMSVAGSDACVRIGGRVHVEYGIRKPTYGGDANWAHGRAAAMRSDAIAPPDVLDGIEQGHLRVHNIGTLVDPFR